MGTQVLPVLNAAERGVMEELLLSKSLDHSQATRLQVVLGRADGKTAGEIAAVLRIHPVTVSDIVHHFNERGLHGLLKQLNHKPGKTPLSQDV
jgi:transposase